MQGVSGSFNTSMWRLKGDFVVPQKDFRKFQYIHVAVNVDENDYWEFQYIHVAVKDGGYTGKKPYCIVSIHPCGG